MTESNEIPQGRLRRTAPVAGAVARTAGEAVVAALRSKVTGTPVSIDHAAAAERYAKALGRSRGALMKVGQALSFVQLGAAVPPEMRGAFQNALGRLRADAPPMPEADARMVLRSELGSLVDRFASFDWTPIAAASIGQVHRAALVDGREVAVKLQYPGVREAIDADLANHELLSTFLGLMSGFWPTRMNVDMRQVAAEIGAQVRLELDYTREAANQREFAALYRGHPFIHVPEVVDELSTGRVLTQDFVAGLSWEQALGSEQALRDQWAEVIARFAYGSMDYFRVLNLDTHPGNFLFHDDGRVSFLDYGSVIRMPPRFVGWLNDLTRAIVAGDVDRVWEVSVREGMWTDADPVTREEAFDYWRRGMELYWEPQPYTVDGDVIAASVASRFSPTGACANAVQHIRSPDNAVLMYRMDLGVVSMLAELHATNDWRGIFNEFMEDGPPATPLGEQHLEFLRAHPTAIQHA